MMRIKYIKEFSETIINNEIKEITIRNEKYKVDRGHNYSINNQGGYLQKGNYLKGELEYLISSNEITIPVSLQIYENDRGHYRLFVYNKKGMLTSINLTNCYEDGCINLKIQMKLSSRKVTKEERVAIRNLMTLEMERSGVKILEENTAYFGKYDVVAKKFVDTNPDEFLKKLLTAAIIKGHYMDNKGYKLFAE